VVQARAHVIGNGGLGSCILYSAWGCMWLTGVHSQSSQSRRPSPAQVLARSAAF
jgi:hypothetical protein